MAALENEIAFKTQVFCPSLNNRLTCKRGYMNTPAISEICTRKDLFHGHFSPIQAASHIC